MCIDLMSSQQCAQQVSGLLVVVGPACLVWQRRLLLCLPAHSLPCHFVEYILPEHGAPLITRSRQIPPTLRSHLEQMIARTDRLPCIEPCPQRFGWLGRSSHSRPTTGPQLMSVTRGTAAGRAATLRCSSSDRSAFSHRAG